MIKKLSFCFLVGLGLNVVFADEKNESDSTSTKKDAKENSVSVDNTDLNLKKEGISLGTYFNFGRRYKTHDNKSSEQVSRENSKKEEEPKKQPMELRFSGYARLWAFYRNMFDYNENGMLPQDASPDNLLKEYPTLPVNYSLSDGYQEPLALIRVEGNPSLKTWFQMEYYFDHRIGRRLNSIYNSINTDTNGRAATVYRIFQFTGGTHTKLGTFKLTAGGGVNWYKLSPFTLWQYQNRDDLFERYPWEPEGNDFTRYDSYYSLGDIPRDVRWGNQGTQGFIIEATGLPKGLSASLIYGKNQNSGGFVSAGSSFGNQPPQNMLAGRVSKKVKSHDIGFNFFNQYGYNPPVSVSPTTNRLEKFSIKGDSSYFLEIDRISQFIATVDGRLNFNGLKVFAEAGLGSFMNNEYNNGLPTQTRNTAWHYITKPWVNNPDASRTYRYERRWDPALFFEFDFDKSLTKVPFKLALYHIGTYVINNTSAINNSSIENFRASPSQGNANVINYFQGMVTEINQYANNRQGVNLNTNFKWKGLKILVDYANSREIDNLYGDNRTGYTRDNEMTPGVYTNGISFQHRTNQLARSRFGFFERYLGPYNRTMNIYRRSYDNIQITDTVVNYRKHFNTMDFTLKYKMKILTKDIILSNYINYNSVQDFLSPIPVLTDQAFLRQFYEEFMAFYQIHSKVTLVGFVSLERALGNNRTELADSLGNLITSYNPADPTSFAQRPVRRNDGKAINQFAYGYGIGLD
ncbi:MAG: hypothetical protein SNJ77_07630, partial [Cytophagales bacterium]